MSEPFIGEIRCVSFSFAPRGWALCNGQILPISQNQALFSLLGTTYGGDGQTTFALPNLQGRMPIHAGSAIPLGQAAGEATHTLTLAEIPAHNHAAMASSNNADQTSPANNFWATESSVAYADEANVNLAPQAVAPRGGNQAHENWSPYLVLNFIIALQGIFPPRD